MTFTGWVLSEALMWGSNWRLGWGSASTADAAGEEQAPNGFHLMAYDVQNSFDYDPGTIPFYDSLSSTDADEVPTY